MDKNGCVKKSSFSGVDYAALQQGVSSHSTVVKSMVKRVQTFLLKMCFRFFFVENILELL